ncbi:hypothetical protein [Nannocystis pusilla]|uniref:hypothetical protein n=1 Tax=Nannocystis pusilla TaxID=889268 RepID=UPI003B7BA4D0
MWAAPRFVLGRLLVGADPLPAGALTYAPWLVASVDVRTAPRGIGARLAWDNVPLAGPSLGYVVATHGESADARRPGAVLTYYEPLCGDGPAELAAQRQRLLAGDLSTWSDHVVAALAAMHPGIASEISGIAVTRWGHAMIRPVPGLLFGESLARARAPLGRLRPCAADVAGLPLFEEAFIRVAAPPWPPSPTSAAAPPTPSPTSSQRDVAVRPLFLKDMSSRTAGRCAARHRARRSRIGAHYT